MWESELTVEFTHMIRFDYRIKGFQSHYNKTTNNQRFQPHLFDYNQTLYKKESFRPKKKGGSNEGSGGETETKGLKKLF